MALADNSQSTTRRVVSWAMWDWGTQPFNTVIITFVFSVYLTSSAFGDTNQYGTEGLKFWTKVKTVTQRWPDGGGDGSNAFIIPTMG